VCEESEIRYRFQQVSDIDRCLAPGRISKALTGLAYSSAKPAPTNNSVPVMWRLPSDARNTVVGAVLSPSALFLDSRSQLA
jgi:hypothetical protein